MDDFVLSNLHESRNEWASRLLTIFTPLVIEGFRSIFEESYILCKSNNEIDKYLMTFQNFITRIPKWNSTIIENEKNRIIKKSGCSYLEDLITCVHIIQLKLLTSIRVGQKQKKINISIPKLDDFIHKVYIHVARKIYKNVYLFELNIQPLQTQKHARELEIIIQECILNAIRESIPVESILRAYMDETTEEDCIEEVKEQVIEEPITMDDIKRHQESEKTHIISEETPPPSSTMNGVVSRLESDDYNNNNNNRSNAISDDYTPLFPKLDKEESDLFNNTTNTSIEKDDFSNLRVRMNESENTLNNYTSSYDDVDDDKIQISNNQVDLNITDIHELDSSFLNNDDLLEMNDFEMLV